MDENPDLLLLAKSLPTVPMVEYGVQSAFAARDFAILLLSIDLSQL
jgi:hypothetical protein